MLWPTSAKALANAAGEVTGAVFSGVVLAEYPEEGSSSELPLDRQPVSSLLAVAEQVLD